MNWKRYRLPLHLHRDKHPLGGCVRHLQLLWRSMILLELSWGHMPHTASIRAYPSAISKFLSIRYRYNTWKANKDNKRK